MSTGMAVTMRPSRRRQYASDRQDGESEPSTQVYIRAPGPDQQRGDADDDPEDAYDDGTDQQAEEEPGDAEGDEERHVRLVGNGHGRLGPGVDAGGDRRFLVHRPFAAEGLRRIVH